MVFNPYDIQTQHDALQQALVQLPWASPQLQDNVALVLLVMIFVVADLLACNPKGVMVHQLNWLVNTRNARTYEDTAVAYPWIKPILICQYFIFFGLCLYCAYDPMMAEHLASPDWQMIKTLLICLAIPLAWNFIQEFLYNWFCYLFNIRDRQIIMSRSYHSCYIVLAPITTLIFIALLAGSASPQTILFLLAVLFILSQIVFIFSGFKIFCVNFYALCFIIVYLCTLEIAPLLVIYTKFLR